MPHKHDHRTTYDRVHRPERPGTTYGDRHRRSGLPPPCMCEPASPRLARCAGLASRTSATTRAQTWPPRATSSRCASAPIVATIYRRADLFMLVQHANPALQRRQAEQVYQKTIQQLQEALEKARADAEYY
ncbi:hypothetical protein [Dictyobacter formicarum]|uniref:hypothetical protein n=1 Tax=Dictyobacter formicarum TaxID=2778368 RepID=UPI0019168D72|nr:hypothetical protein [Dictyobacter formicarum]